MSESGEDNLVAKIAAPMIASFKKSRKFNSQNRSAWKRMNRPCKAIKIEAGVAFIDKFLKNVGI
jgi:hypothetical protein